MEFYLAEALRLFAMAEDTPDLQLAERLLRWMSSRSSGSSRLFYTQQIYRYGPGQIRNKETATRILNLLCDHGWIRPVPRAIEIDGAMRTSAWELRP